MIKLLLGAVGSLLLLAINNQLFTARAQGTAFSYQGQLNGSNGPANGIYDVQFTLYGTNVTGLPVTGSVTNTATPVTNGLFLATVDFGPGVFTGSNYWLDLAVRTNGAATFTELAPRQPVPTTPYAVFANSAGTVTGVLPSASLPPNPAFPGSVSASSFAGNGANVTNVNASALNGLNAANFWQLTGNTVAGGQFLGTTNNLPLQLDVNGARALLLVAGPAGEGSPTVIGGAPNNFTALGLAGATIGGGGAVSYYGHPYPNSVTADFGTVSGGQVNQAGGTAATVGGGNDNIADGIYATIAGGNGNVAGDDAAVGGGANNAANYSFATVGGGSGNTIFGNNATIAGGKSNMVGADAAVGGGLGNTATGTAAVVAGGSGNVATGDNAFVGGGNGNTNLSPGAVLGGGIGNAIQTNSGDAFIGGGNANIVAGNNAFIGAGNANTNLSPGAVLVGGIGNAIQTNSGDAFIGGGNANVIQPLGGYSAIVGGLSNIIMGAGSFIGGGGYDGQTAVPNYISGLASVIDGGLANNIFASYSHIGGGHNNSINGNNSVVGGGYFNQAGQNFTTVSGGYGNQANGSYATIGGGYGNYAGTDESAIGGGAGNSVGSYDSTIGGGSGNNIQNNSYYATISGGNKNQIEPNAGNAFIGGGNANVIEGHGDYSVIAGGMDNDIANGGQNGAIAGGINNTISGANAMIPGGSQNSASGSNSFAAGFYAQATNNGSFVWSDSSSASPFVSTNNNSFNVRAAGGVRLSTAGAGLSLDGHDVLTTASVIPGFSVQQNAAGAPNVIEGSSANYVSSGVIGATISGGGVVDYYGDTIANWITYEFGTVGGGLGNEAGGTSDGFATVGGGNNNVATGDYSTLGGGAANQAFGDYSSIAGGNGNTSVGNFSSVGGGNQNFSTGNYSAVGGGSHNIALGAYATVCGGSNNLAAGQFSFAGGQQAAAVSQGSFVWADSQNAAFTSTASDQFIIRAQGGVGIGTANPLSALDVNGVTRTRSIVITGGSDLAEPFNMGAGDLAKGSVVVIDPQHPGQLKLSSQAYDTRVAGVVSGANGINPGISLHQDGALAGGQNVALTGRVYVLADAANGAIEPGDLLTTAATPGHAMKVSDHQRATGAILGKAMTALSQGQGMVLVLVTLQ